MLPPLEYQIALSFFPRIGAVTARKLVAYMGSVQSVFESPKSKFYDIPGIGKTHIKNLLEGRDNILRQAEREVKFLQQYNIKSYFFLDKNYPRRLAQCSDAPIIFYMKGDVDLNCSKIISVVGTRNATTHGREMTESLIAEIARQGVKPVIVSGLAYGIDIAAHKSALKHELSTIGVLAHGLNKIYPSQHSSVAKNMVRSNGALLSDFPSECKMDPGNFLRRNRIIAGLADCTVVVESAAKGGALVTADIANSYNRDVFAYPGRTTDEFSAGCNALIKNNKAALIESGNDLIEFMGWEAQNEPVQQTLLIDLDKEETLIVSALKQNEVSTTDFISREVNLPVQKINSLLLNLEFKGAVKSLPGNRFKLIGNVQG